nr:MAG TPA: hypothetical protein [Caudoviricetes sp.]
MFRHLIIFLIHKATNKKKRHSLIYHFKASISFI